MPKDIEMRINKVFGIFFAVTLLACTSVKKENLTLKSSPDNDSVLSEKFFASLSTFVSKNPSNFDKNIKGMPDIQNNKARFHFLKRVMLPLSFNRMTFDYWTYLPCKGGCYPYNFLFIHNDSKDYLFPLTDDHIYWENSNRSDSDSSKPAIFANEFSAFTASFSIPQNSAQGVLDIIMDFRNYERIGEQDIPKLKFIASKISANGTLDSRCKNELEANIKTAEKWIKENRLVYSNGFNVLMFSIENSEIWKLETLNTDCNRTVSF